MPFTYAYPRPSVTVDCVVFGIDASRRDGEDGDGDQVAEGTAPGCKVLLVQRRAEPHKGEWALPGGFVEVSDTGDQGEDLEAAARRELQEETGLVVDYLEQLYTFGAPRRDPRGRVISVAYYALVRSTDHQAHAGSDAADVRWFALPTAGARKPELAFDHGEVLAMAIGRLQAKVRYAPIGFNLLPPRFTLTELQRLYEAVLARGLDKRNFRKRILAMGILADAGRQQNVPHRAATLYRFDKRAYDRAVKQGFNFEI
jgi:8-oxo-dGTP diphosphatase